MRQRVVFIVETVGGGVRTHVLQLLKNLDPERYELTLIYGERYDHVFESQREELAKHVTLILDSNLVRSAGLRASWKAVKSLRATLRRIKPDIVALAIVRLPGPLDDAAAKLEHVPKIFYTPACLCV
ncbi:MAG: glycosyltransferase [Bifidobacterium sp.]